VAEGVRLFWEVARRGFRRYATYRAATVAGVFTNTVFAFIRAYILIALYRQRPHLGGLDVRQAVTYAFVTQGFLMPMALFGWTEIEDRVRSGDVITDLYRPVDFQLYWMAQDSGRAAFQFLARGIPPVAVGAVFFRLVVPAGVATWPVFLLSAAVGLVVSFGTRFALSLTAFWLVDIKGLSQILVVTTMFFGGVILPINTFPHWLEVVARALPFASMVHLPVEVYLGRHPGADAVAVLATQAAWAVVLLGLGRLVLARATRKVVIQGG